MKHKFVTVLGREIHYTEWGVPSDNRPSVVCWHGLARTGRDFDILARCLSEQHGMHVVCPDTIGRGLSEWSPVPDEEYNVEFYIKLAKELLDALGLSRVLWFGTSMGGIIGYMGAATALRPYIQKLILNDIGPRLCDVAIQRIIAYAAVPPQFKTFCELEKCLTNTYQAFGIHDPEWIRLLVQVGSRRTNEGKWTTHYDPRVIDMLRTGFCTGSPEFVKDPWSLYDAVSCDVLTIRGSTSDLFDADTLQEMTQRGPKCKSVTIDGVGHAPAMNTPDQCEIVVSFFCRE